MPQPAYRRILLKLSGEVLAGNRGFGIDPQMASHLADEIKSVYDLNVRIGLIIGAGNIFRGMEAASKGMDRVTGDYLGMLATIMNAISLQDALENIGVETRTLSAITASQISEPYIRRRALRHLDKKRIVIFSAGTGNPYFTTDSAAVLRAIEIEADVILKGTRVDGIYNDDPNKNSKAFKFEKITFNEAINKGLKIMDTTAFTLSHENNLPIIVFDMNQENNLIRVLNGENIGTLVNL